MKIDPLPKRCLLQGGTIIDPLGKQTFRGDILIEKKRIRAVGKVDRDPSQSVIDCSGLVITHGFCDLHAHFREPGREDKETLATGTRAALAGGFTRVCVMPNTEPPLDDPEAIMFIREKAQNLAVHIHPVGAVTQGQQGVELAELGAMAAAGAVAFSDDGIPIRDGNVMRRALEYAGMFGLPVINHAEDPDLAKGGVMNEGAVSTRLGLPGNPALSEVVMVQRDLELALFTNSRLHIPHVSTAGAVRHIRRARRISTRITAEVTPHHLFFNDEALVTYNTHLKVAPPLRNEEDRQALIKAVEDGDLDCIATDHAPHTIEEKEATFDMAPCGMIGLESCFGAVNRILGQEHGLPLEQIIALLTVNPRRIMGFETDLLARNTEAELVIFDPQQRWIFSEADIHSRSKNSPYLGQELVGKVVMTISRGHLAQI